MNNAKDAHELQEKSRELVKGRKTREEGAIAGQPAPQDKLGPQQKDPLQPKLQDLDMQLHESQKVTQRVVK